MSSFLMKISSVYSPVYFSELKKTELKYTTGIYTGGVKIKEWSSATKEEKKLALSRKWYVWWSYRHPVSGKLVRQPNSIKGDANRKTSKVERMKILKLYRKSLIKFLENGYNPYDEDQEAKEFDHVITGKGPDSIEFAFRKALSIKEKEVNKRTFKDYKYTVARLEKHLINIGISKIHEVRKEHVASFLSQFKPRTSNNKKADLSPVFSVLSDQGLIKFNFVKELRNKKPPKNKKRIFTENEIAKITKLLKEQDPQLLMFIKLVAIMFWRPVENIRITIDEIDFDKRLMSVDTKTKNGKTKIIPNLILDSLKEFCKDKETFLFYPEGMPNWDISDEYKRNHFTKRFNRFRKKNNIDPELKMVSFRHTYITALYLELRKTMTVEEAIKHLSLITGHESNAIKHYIVVNDLELPTDYSKYYLKTSLFN